MNNDLVYLDRRAKEERRAALKSRSREVADIHFELAQAYEFRLFMLKQLETFRSAPAAAAGDGEGPALVIAPGPAMIRA